MIRGLLQTIGTDVEFFIKRAGKIIPATPQLIKGTKEVPHKMSNISSIQLDNVLGELTFRPAEGGRNFRDLAVHAKDELKMYLKAVELQAVFKSSHNFKASELRTPWGKVFGCEPDFPADLADDMSPPDMEIARTLRTGSGHIHFGLNKKKSPEDIIRLVRGLDFMLGAPLLVGHNDSKRRQMYGRAGRFRFKPYGFEYRTPDNWWFSKADIMAERIWSISRELFSIGSDHTLWKKVDAHHSDLCAAINSGNVDQTMDIISYVGLPTIDCDVRKQKTRGYKADAFANYVSMVTSTTENLWTSGEEGQVG